MKPFLEWIAIIVLTLLVFGAAYINAGIFGILLVLVFFVLMVLLARRL